MSLFQIGDYVLSSGIEVGWKIECDALTESDWDALMIMALDVLPPFACVVGVPRGGYSLCARLQEFSNPEESDLTLVVDDVLTTGASMEAYKLDDDTIGLVVFARGVCPDWITPLFQMPT